MKYIRENENRINGKVWLNIIEIGRYAELDEFTRKYLVPRFDGMYPEDEYSLRTVKDMKQNM